MPGLKIIYLLVMLGAAWLSDACAGNGSINGSVTGEDGPLSFATVSLNEGFRTTHSDEAGRFLLDGLENGSYKVTVSYVGYRAFEDVVSLGTGQQIDLAVVLQPVNELDAVVVTGTLKPTYISQSPVKIEVVTSKRLNTFLPTAGSSIMESIALVNGVQEVVSCGVCYTNSVSINGLAGQYTALLMDGTPIFGSLASVYGLNGIPNAIIDRFEVIKGPSSTLYGSEAVGGVINVITKDPADQPLISIDGSFSSHLETFADFTAAPRIGNTSGLIGVNLAYKNYFDDHNGDGFGDDILLDRYALFTKWNIGRSSGKEFTIAAKYYFEDRRNGLEAFVRNRAYRDLRGDDSIYGESIYTHRTELFGAYELPGRPPVRLNFSYSSHWQDSYYGSDHYKAEQHVGYANLYYNLVRGRHDLITGFTARYQHYDDNTTATADSSETGIQNAADNQYVPGLFAQHEWTVTEKVTVLTGIRLDYYNRHGLIPSPRFNLKIQPGTWTTLRINFGTGFRVVNLFTEDHAFVTGQRQVVIAESLDPERSYNVSLNVNHIFNGGNGTGSIDVEGYYTYFSNKIIPDYTTPGRIIYSNVAGHAQTGGFSANLNYSFTIPLTFSVAVNAQRASEFSVENDGQRSRADLEFAPYWSGVATISYTWEKAGLEFAYSVDLTGHMPLPEVYDLDAGGSPMTEPRPTVSSPFAIQNLKISKRFEKPWTLYFGLNNIGNFRQKESPLTGYNDPNAAPGFSDFFDTAYAYAPSHGIEFYIGMKWNLERD